MRIDRTRQLLHEQHIELSADGITMGPGVHRYTYPSELDLMARIAGLRLRERWGGWSRESFTARSETVVSVFEQAS